MAKFHTPFWKFDWGDSVHFSALVCLLCVAFFLRVEVVHYADLQGLNALIRSKLCTMLLIWGGGLRTVAVIRQAKKQSGDGQYHPENFH